jgi:hypothetical protein
MIYRGGMSRLPRGFLRRVRTWLIAIALPLSPVAACGSSKPKAPEPQPPEAKVVAPEGPPEMSEFCSSYTRIYCVHEPEGGYIKETSYEEMTPEEQELVLGVCEDTWASASEAQRQIMNDCAGCINDCGYTEGCLTATSSGCLDFDEEQPEED